jgi:hypothetical protein
VLATLGSPDPRLQPSGKLDIRLSRQLSAYKKEDPPPARVKPIPFPIIAHTAQLAYIWDITGPSHSRHALVRLLFSPTTWRVCPHNEPRRSPILTPRHSHTHKRQKAEPPPMHRSRPTSRQLHSSRIHHAEKRSAGRTVGLGRTGHPTWCPIAALINRIKHLRAKNAPLTTPLYAYYDTSWRSIDTTTLTMQLHTTVTVLGPTYGIQPSDISIHSLRSSGAMALLCAKVDTDMIHLLGRWRSNEMLRYLHVQSFPLLAPLAQQMLRHGHYTLIPNLPMG